MLSSLLLVLIKLIYLSWVWCYSLFFIIHIIIVIVVVVVVVESKLVYEIPS